MKHRMYTNWRYKTNSPDDYKQQKYIHDWSIYINSKKVLNTTSQPLAQFVNEVLKRMTSYPRPDNIDDLMFALDVLEKKLRTEV